MRELVITRKNIIAATFFVVLSLLFWLEPNIFFYNDDWRFVDKYLDANRLQFIFTSYFGHIKPVFESFFFAELFAFGKNTVFFQITALILFGLMAFIFSRIYREASAQNAFAAMIVPVLWMSHPNCGDVTLWLFQVCIILHVLFQALTILFYFKYRSSRSHLHFYLFIIALVLQDFSFGNGIFFPILFIFAELLEAESGFRPTKRIMCFLPYRWFLS